tara:strand:+ start:261 stop:413 length:153 start_codon:yes stop_codon:yes gene_type:complete
LWVYCCVVVFGGVLGLITGLLIRSSWGVLGGEVVVVFSVEVVEFELKNEI